MKAHGEHFFPIPIPARGFNPRGDPHPRINCNSPYGTNVEPTHAAAILDLHLDAPSSMNPHLEAPSVEPMQLDLVEAVEVEQRHRCLLYRARVAPTTGSAPRAGFASSPQIRCLHCRCALRTRASASRGLCRAVDGLGRELHRRREIEGRRGRAIDGIRRELRRRKERGGLGREEEDTTRRIREGGRASLRRRRWADDKLGFGAHGRGRERES